MEKMPYQAHADMPSTVARSAATPVPTHMTWRHGLPTLTGAQVILRELRFSDAPALLAAMSTAEVSSFISPPPATLDAREVHLMGASQRCRRTVPLLAAWCAVPSGRGLFQIRRSSRVGTRNGVCARRNTGPACRTARGLPELAFASAREHSLEAARRW